MRSWRGSFADLFLVVCWWWFSSTLLNSQHRSQSTHCLTHCLTHCWSHPLGISWFWALLLSLVEYVTEADVGKGSIHQRPLCLLSYRSIPLTTDRRLLYIQIGLTENYWGKRGGVRCQWRPTALWWLSGLSWTGVVTSPVQLSVCVCVLGGRLKAFKSVDCENLTSACSSYELLMCCPYIVSAVSLTLA